MKILALDLGKRRIGLAVSDELGVTAQGLPTLQRKNNRSDLAALSHLVHERSVDRILIGNPLHMSGDAGFQADLARQFAELVGRHTGKEVKMWDERLTTVEAMVRFHSNDMAEFRASMKEFSRTGVGPWARGARIGLPGQATRDHPPRRTCSKPPPDKARPPAAPKERARAFAASDHPLQPPPEFRHPSAPHR